MAALFCLFFSSVFFLSFSKKRLFFSKIQKKPQQHKRANCFTSHHMGQLLTKLLGGSSSLTEAEIDKLTVSKLRKLLDAKKIAYEKKEVKAALAAKLKDAMRKEKEEEDSDECTKRSRDQKTKETGKSAKASCQVEAFPDN